jgi:hypothetical protein
MNTGTHALLHDASLHVHMNVCHSIMAIFDHPHSKRKTQN